MELKSSGCFACNNAHICREEKFASACRHSRQRVSCYSIRFFTCMRQEESNRPRTTGERKKRRNCVNILPGRMQAKRNSVYRTRKQSTRFLLVLSSLLKIINKQKKRAAAACFLSHRNFHLVYSISSGCRVNHALCNSFVVYALRSLLPVCVRFFYGFMCQHNVMQNDCCCYCVCFVLPALLDVCFFLVRSSALTHTIVSVQRRRDD